MLDIVADLKPPRYPLFLETGIQESQCLGPDLFSSLVRTAREASPPTRVAAFNEAAGRRYSRFHSGPENAMNLFHEQGVRDYAAAAAQIPVIDFGPYFEIGRA